MVDTSLNKRYNAKASSNNNFGPAPEDDYRLVVKDISDWKATTQDVQVIQKDEDGNTLVNEKGEKVRELVKGCTFYNALVTLEIVDGEYKGKRVFYNLTTHPNMDFSISNYLYGVGMDSLSPEDIKETIGKECNAHVIVESYNKTVQNKDTGMDETVSRETNKVKSFKKPTTPNMEEPIDFDFGI